jgi:hypothetical protein
MTPSARAVPAPRRKMPTKTLRPEDAGPGADADAYYDGATTAAYTAVNAQTQRELTSHVLDLLQLRQWPGGYRDGVSGGGGGGGGGCTCGGVSLDGTCQLTASQPISGGGGGCKGGGGRRGEERGGSGVGREGEVNRNP